MKRPEQRVSLRKQHCFLILLLFIIALVAVPVQGGTVTPNEVGFQHLSVEHGLSQSSIRCMMQDEAGFLWFGTEDGLNRYDGYTFTVYRHDPEDPNSLGYDTINDLCEGADGSIWVATIQGLDRLDRSTDSFTHFHAVSDVETSLSHDRTIAVHSDAAGRIWVGTAAGLDRYEPSTNDFTHHNQSRNGVVADGTLLVRRILEDNEGMLWLGTNRGVERFDPESGEIRAWRSDPDDPATLSAPVVLSLCQAPSGHIWVGTASGLNSIDPQSGRVTRITADLSTVNLALQPIISLLIDSRGVIWAGTLAAGVCTLDTAGGCWRQYRHVPGDPTTLSFDSNLSTMEDRSGLVWIGSAGSGLDIFDRDRKPFILHTHIPGNPDSIQHLVVRTITGDRRGNRWVGTVAGGLTRIDAVTGEHRQYLPVAGDPHSLSARSIWYALVDSRGTLWAGTAGGGLNRYRPESDDFVSYRNDPDDPTSIGVNNLQYLFEDRSGRLWIGTGGGGVNLMDTGTGTFTRFMNDPGDPASLSANGVYCIAQQTDGTIWVATNGGGLNRYDEETGTFHRFRHDPNDPTTISDDRVLSLYPADDGTLWVGTGLGLNHFDPAVGTFRRYYAGDGLPNNVIYSILEDETGDLWISTNNGLARFRPPAAGDVPFVRTYDMSDGLQSNEFNSGSSWKSPDGTMFFGGINGYSSFHPDEIAENRIVPPVVLTRITVPGLELPDSRPNSSRASVTLPHRFNNIHVQFSALNYRQPEKNRYSHMLEGLDEGWSEADNQRRATYTNLDPGHYTLRVRASNNDGVWSEEEAVLVITVTPPFWQRGWFLVLAALALAAGVTAAYRHRVRVLGLRGELQTARDTQVSILPQASPRAEGYDIAGTCIPANTVGGDFYDFIWLDDDRSVLGIAVADVAGKSMDAALTAVLTTGVVQAEARRSHSAAEVVAAANLPVYTKTSRSTFAALCFARLDLSARKLAFTNAGLMEPLLKRASGEIELLKSEGSKLPLGIIPDGEYEETAVQLEAGDLLLLLTDGIPESQDQAHRFYEMESLRILLEGMETGGMSAGEILDAIIADVRRFTAGAPQHDDITAVALKVL